MGDSKPNGRFARFTDELDGPVFLVGFLTALVAVVAFALIPDTAAEAVNNVNSFLWQNVGWVYILAMFFIVVFALFLVFGPWGNIKLGKPDEEPQYSFLSYFSMLYSAGIAAGIVFWGPAEAIFHYDTVPPFVGGESQTADAAVGAVQYTFFHWGLSAWAAYAIMSLPIAFYTYRHDAPMRISTVLAPFLGVDNLDSVWAKLVDILAVFATLGGIATTLGFVGSQFLTGIEYTTGVSVGDAGTVLAITALTIAFTLSVTLGIEKGIRRVSQFNMGLFMLVMLLAFILGPSVYIMTVTTEALGQYINQFVAMSFFLNAGNGASWVGSWTVFYWAWWFSWTPFVGLFIARVSRGRTIRQVVATGVLASTGITIPWFGIMGSTAIKLQSTNAADILGVISEYGVAGSGYPLFEALPVGGVLNLLFLLLITTFFVTSADSSTLALGMLTTGGELEPSTINRVIWGGLVGALASLLMVVGGVNALQAASIITGGPFAIITLLAVAAIIYICRDIRPIFFDTRRPDTMSESSTNFDAPDDMSAEGADDD
ncbi:BCCT family transporter [Natrinema versiforme]|uniref:Choline/carnitine/betaine transporter n=1 Tax=Natrinema versiforme JCM 10478 TaxID=1227496 RepID=L9XM99_9EURY|nr:BCCT family transporter [Natrinema versiforme]ELY62919.1 choline/carnitine/betaine transporter [Natrinema versiforme JCM 10478]